MPLRMLLRYLLQNEQVIQKVAESYPVRRAAQLTAYLIHRGKEIGEEGLEKVQEGRQKASSFQDTFSKEFNKGMEELKDRDNKMRKDK